MSRRNFFLPAAALVAVLLFSWLLVRILLLRYERGDIYPPDSTLRNDPLGAHAFYEAVGALDGYQVGRGFVPVHRELAGKPTTFFYLGLSLADLEALTESERDALDAFVRGGGRVVVTLQPEADAEEETPAKGKSVRSSEKNGPKKGEATPPAPSKPEVYVVPKTRQEKYERDKFQKEQNDETNAEKRELENKYQPSLSALWGFGWKRHGQADDAAPVGAKAAGTADGDNDHGAEMTALRAGSTATEDEVPWKSPLYFIRLEPEWQVQYQAAGQPVLVRRSWGKGEIVLASDSYFLSNEALRNDRRPALLSFIAGPPGRLLFDEVHLGTQEQEGVMVLARRFRLEGYLYGMLFVAALFLWRNSIPLVPPRQLAGGSVLGGSISGKDSQSGLVNLLRRNIAASDLLRTCLAEWKRGVTPRQVHLHPRVAEMEAVVAAADTGRALSIVQVYQHLREINAPRRSKGNYAAKS
jgi:hypothetical protein